MITILHPQAERPWGPAIDQILAQEDVASGGVSWLIQDRLGSVRDVVNNAGQVVNRIDYDGFGRITSIVDPSNGNAPLPVAATAACALPFFAFLWNGQPGKAPWSRRS